MTLVAGQSLSHYTILGPLGAGAMGAVYLARDQRLEREVAIKVLPEEFSGDEERLQRFEREAKTLAALNHPNVAQIHQVDQVGDTCFLVLELVPGESLEERLRRGPLPLDEALEVCRQIAEGLEAAHEAGVIHRDLKPANVRVTPEGRVKVLDFGLAKPMRAGKDSRATDSVLSTEQGRLLGTPTYMAPEQARGRAIDRRVDVWAFGCVLFECLTGKRAFDGESLSDVLGSVLRDEPALAALPASTPDRVRELIVRCLHKDPFQRLRDVGEARLVFQRAPEPKPRGAVRSPWPIALAACALLALGVLLWQARAGTSGSGAQPRLAALSVRLDPELNLYKRGNLEQNGVLAISPDSSKLVLVCQRGNQRQLYLRALDSPAITPIEGSDGAIGPFFSPDGRWLAFFAHGQLFKAPIGGGKPIALCEVGLTRGGAWGPDDTIVFTPTATAPLMRIPASGGTPSELSELDATGGERSHRWPVFLPGGREVAFTVGTVDKPGDYDDSTIDAVALDTRERRKLVRGASFVRVLAPDELVLGRGDQLFVLPLASLSGGPLGGAAVALEGVAGVAASGVLHYDISAEGDLAYAERDPLATQFELVWLAPDGTLEPLKLPPREYQTPRISPDGKRIVVGIGPGGGRATDLWMHDLERGSMTRFTFDERSGTPSWTADGQRVLFGSGKEGHSSFQWKLADGTDEGELLVNFTDSVPRFPSGLTPTGELLPFVNQGTAGTAQDIFYWSRRDGAEHPLARTSAGENYPALSPDGEWIAYVTDESGVREVYVQAFPERRGRWQVSEGGSCPVWARDGSELFYVDGKTIRAVSVSTQPSFSSGPPRTVAELDFLPSSESLVNFDVAPDGRLLLVRGTSQSSYEGHVNVILGWGEGLRRTRDRD